MANIGEELVGAYLKTCLDCDFVDFNIYTRDVQGEIDVIGVNFKGRKIYICEVATHPITGLWYVKNRRVNNVNKLSEKFDRNIAYGKKYYKGFERHYMLWSPVIKRPRNLNAQGNQMRDIETIKKYIQDKYNINLELVMNEDYLKRLNELREIAKKTTEECKLGIMRLFQIEEWTKKNIDTLARRNRRAGKTMLATMK